MTELKIEEGKYYQCRNGEKAYVLKILDNPKRKSEAIIGFNIESSGHQDSTQWCSNGKFYEDDEPSSWDIVSEWQDEPKVGWVYDAVCGEHKTKIKFLYKRRDTGAFYAVNLTNDYFLIIGADLEIQGTLLKLKLETGRPAEDL